MANPIVSFLEKYMNEFFEDKITLLQLSYQWDVYTNLILKLNFSDDEKKDFIERPELKEKKEKILELFYFIDMKLKNRKSLDSSNEIYFKEFTEPKNSLNDNLINYEYL